MKHSIHLLIISALLTAILLSCSSGSLDYPLIENPELFQMSSATATEELDNEEYTIQYGTFYVPENRGNTESRLIGLPYKIYLSPEGDKNPPVFHLAGGPGQSNLNMKPWSWILEDHHFVQLGYRGVDGETVLDAPRFTKHLKKSKGNPIGQVNLNNAARAFEEDLQSFENEGIDLAGYDVLDVIEDIADFQKAIEAEKIHLWSSSYGTRLAYYYGLDYPGNIDKSLMVSVNPPGAFVWEVPYIENDLKHYDELWDSVDFMSMMEVVLENLPEKWLFFELQRQKIEAVTFIALFHRYDATPSAAQVFDAYKAAYEGDYSGLAVLNLFYGFVMPSLGTWGEFFMKGGSADYDPLRNYREDLYDPDRLVNSPFSAFIWGMAELVDFNWPRIPDSYRRPRESHVETLMVSGNVDFSTPAARAAEDLSPVLKRGHQVILKEFGHVSDVYKLQPEAFERLARTFLESGEVDDSQFHYEPMDFTPTLSFQKMAKIAAAVIIGFPILIIDLIILGIILKRRRK